MFAKGLYNVSFVFILSGLLTASTAERLSDSVIVGLALIATAIALDGFWKKPLKLVLRLATGSAAIMLYYVNPSHVGRPRRMTGLDRGHCSGLGDATGPDPDASNLVELIAAKRIHENDSHEQLSNGLDGRTKEQKQRLAERITSDFVETVNVRPEQVTVVFKENKAVNV